MSLIHDALKSMDATAPQAAAPALAARAPARSSSATRGGRPAWVDGVLTFAVVVGVGGAGWTYWQSEKSPKVAALPVVERAYAPAIPVEPVPALNVPDADVPATVGVVPVPASVPPAPASAVPVPAAPQAPVSVPATSIIAQTPSHAQDVHVVQQAASPTPAMERAAPAARPVAVSSRTTRPAVASVQAADMPATAPAVDDAPVELRFARFVAAMKGGRTADAEHELSALKARLPAGSLGLMRAQAWFDLRGGNDAAAAEQYRAILERMAGDEEAAINLASILARQGKPEEARATLDSAVRLQPDSVSLRSALAQFTPNARQ